MGMSLRAQAYLREQRRLRDQQRAAEDAERDRDLAEFHATYLDRTRASQALGLSVHGFKRQQMAGRGPRPTKMGTSQQARTFWHVDEIQAYLRDPAAYDRQRAAEASS